MEIKQELYMFGVNARVLLLLLKDGELIRTLFSRKFGTDYIASSTVLNKFYENG